jgi:hypothetical protein
MRFAVHWPGNPVAFSRSHGVPRRDISGCIHIRVARVSAGYATEAFVASGFPPSRPTVSTGEEVHRRLGEVSQCLLLHHLAACTQPPDLGAGLGELSALLQVTRRAATSGPPRGLLLDREVPHKPDMRAVVLQHCFLGGSRLQAIAGHSNTISRYTDVPEEVKRRVLPGQKAVASTPPS